MIGDSQDIHCAICGRYLFTEKNVFCPSRPDSPTGMLVRENDHEDILGVSNQMILSVINA